MKATRHGKSFQFSLREIRAPALGATQRSGLSFQFSLREIPEGERGLREVRERFQFSLREILKAYIGVPSAGLLTLYVSCLP